MTSENNVVRQRRHFRAEVSILCRRVWSNCTTLHFLYTVPQEVSSQHILSALSFHRILTLFRDILGMVAGVVKSISISSDMVSVHSFGNAVVPVSDVCNFVALLMRRLFNTMRPITTRMELNRISTTTPNSKQM